MLRTRAAAVLALIGMAAEPALAQARFEWSVTLPFTGGEGLTHGDLVAHDGGVTSLHSRPAASALPLWFMRRAADGTALAEHLVGAPGEIHYEPSLCWDGALRAIEGRQYPGWQRPWESQASGTGRRWRFCGVDQPWPVGPAIESSQILRVASRRSTRPLAGSM